MRFYTTERIGPKRSMTPEGFLLCEEVPIARTGVMLYGPGETPVSAGPDNIVRIERDDLEVFRPETLASFEGKAFVDEHPDQDVTPDNWKNLSKGVTMHVRRGEGGLHDTMLADILVTDPATIKKIDGGKREISCGYDADYEELGPGRGRQTKIIGNHVALVDSGRCGSRCAIGDQQTISNGGKRMKWYDRVREALRKGDTAAATAILDEEHPANRDSNGNIPPVVVNVTTHDKKNKGKDDDDDDDDDGKRRTTDSVKDAVFADKRFTDLSANVSDIKTTLDKLVRDDDDEEEEEEEEEGRTKDDDDDDDKRKRGRDNEKLDALEFEAPPGTGDRARKARDSAYLEDSFQETVALAEIIQPGVKIPTFDKAAKPLKTYDNLCRFRRRVLDQAYQTQPDVRDFVDEVTNGREVKTFDCAGIRTLFNSVGSWKKNQNRDSLRTSVRDGRQSNSNEPRRPVTLADVNKRNEEYYKTH